MQREYDTHIAVAVCKNHMFTYKSIYFLHVHVIICKNRVDCVYSQSLAYSKLNIFPPRPKFTEQMSNYETKKKNGESLKKRRKKMNQSPPSMLMNYYFLYMRNYHGMAA